MLLSRLTRRLAVGLAAVSLVFAAGCGDDDPSSAAGGDASSSPKPADEKIVVGFVTAHHSDQFQEQIWQGARAAAADTGVEVKLAAPPQFDAVAQLKLVEDLVAAGAQGIGTPATSESMRPGLEALMERGIPVVTHLIPDPKLEAPYVGGREYNFGRLTAQYVAEALGGASAQGKVLVGYCAPGFYPLEQRADGVKDTLKELAPNLEVKGPFDTKLAATQAYAAWEALANANSDAKAMIGLCAGDPAQLAKLKQARGYEWIIAGSDTTAENLQAVKDGRVLMVFGQSPFVQGYMSVKMLADTLKAGETSIEPGYLDAGTEIVTKDEVVEPTGLKPLTLDELASMAEDGDALHEYYKPLLTGSGSLADWTKALQPMSVQGS